MRTCSQKSGLALLLAIVPALADTPQSQPTSAVLDRVLEISEQDALNAPSVDWPSVASTSKEILAKDDTETGLTTSIRYVLSKLQDHHSTYRPPQAKGVADRTRPLVPIASSSKSPEGTPVLSINSWSGRDAKLATTDARQALVKALDQEHCGLILDFSQNGGGNM